MEKHFKEQLTAGAINGGKNFVVFYMIEDENEQGTMLKITNHDVNSLNEKYTFIRHAGVVLIFKLKD